MTALIYLESFDIIQHTLICAECDRSRAHNQPCFNCFNRMIGGIKPQAGVPGVAVEMYILSDLWCCLQIKTFFIQDISMIHVTALCIFPLKSHGLVEFGWLLAFLALQPLLVSFVPSPLFGFCCCPPSGRLPFGTCLWISPTVGLPLDFACQFPVDFCSSCSICSRGCIHRPVKDPGLSGA